jgi:D-sedoheptulose 7-phosphate isomerase
MKWSRSVHVITACLQALSARIGTDRDLGADDAFSRWEKATLHIRSERKTVYLIGNGASASMASHVAADLAKNAHVHTEVFSDLSLITAIANDLDYEEVFAEPLRRRMAEGDMLIAISSSGESPNVLRAVEEATRTRGALNLYVPADNYGLAESCHAAILHHWIDSVANARADESLLSVKAPWRSVRDTTGVLPFRPGRVGLTPSGTVVPPSENRSDVAGTKNPLAAVRDS